MSFVAFAVTVQLAPVGKSVHNRIDRTRLLNQRLLTLIVVCHNTSSVYSPMTEQAYQFHCWQYFKTNMWNFNGENYNFLINQLRALKQRFGIALFSAI